MAVRPRPVRLGVVGYGLGGRRFHTPFIEAAEGIELAGVVTRSPVRRAEVDQDWPGIPVFDSLGALLASGVDAVTITTPPETRRELVLEAVAAGVHVVADKPFAPDAAIGLELAETAESAGVLLSVFHNRRWDADIRTLAKLVRSGRLGDLWRVHSRFDLDDPTTLEAGPGGGLLRDLGSHLVDQMVWLLGGVGSVTAHLDWIELPDGLTDAGFSLELEHVSGVRSHVEASKVNHIEARELRAYGSEGSYRALGTDVQAQAIFAGRKPVDDPEGWGFEAPARWGLLATAAGEVMVPSEQGRYHDFYSAFAAAVRGEGPQPVPAYDAIITLAVLDAARMSAERGGSLEVSTSPEGRDRPRSRVGSSRA
jgi:predicted dehydrogenase